MPGSCVTATDSVGGWRTGKWAVAAEYVARGGRMVETGENYSPQEKSGVNKCQASGTGEARPEEELALWGSRSGLKREQRPGQYWTCPGRAGSPEAHVEEPAFLTVLLPGFMLVANQGFLFSGLFSER